MRVARIASWTALVAGLGLLVWAGLTGQLTVNLFLIVPVVSGSGPAAVLGMLLTMGGLVGWVITGFAASARKPPGRASPSGDGQPPEASTETRGGGILLLGPIPIAWGSDRRSLLLILVVAIVLILVALLALAYLG